MCAENRDGAVFGLWLQKRRKQLGMTQVELARRACCSAATVRKLESDERHPSHRLAQVIATTLGVPEGERAAFVQFARSGWADRTPTLATPALEHPWLPRRGDDPPSGVLDGGDILSLRPRLPEATLRPPKLVGREALWAEMERAWEAGRHIFLKGPGGIGKTRLMLDFADSKGPSFLGEGSPGDRILPLGTLRRGFRRFFGQWPDAVSEIPPWARAEASRFLPELYADSPPPLKDEAERSRFFEAQLRLTLILASRVAMALADDLHYWDRSSFEVQSWVTGQIVLRRMTTARSVAAFRPAELPAEFERNVAELVRSGAAVLLDVPSLAGDSVRELLSELEVPPGALDPVEVATVTGGNPMLVIEAVKGWWETRELHGVRSEDGGLASGDGLVIDAARTIQGRLERLDAGDLHLAQAMAVLQDAATPELLADVVGESRLVTAGRLARLEELNMVRDARFVHDLLSEGAAAAISGAQRRLLHTRAAQALTDRGAEPALVAHHLEEAGHAMEALTWRLEAADRALAQGSRIEARRWLAWVLERAPEGSESAARAAVLLGAAWLPTDVDAAHGAFERALASARRAVSPALEARALAGLAQSEALRGRDGEARLHDQAASELTGALPPAERAQLLLDLSEVRWTIGDLGESEELIAEAVQLDPSQPRYRLTLARFHWHRGRYEDAIEELHAVLQSDPGSARLTRLLHDLGQNYRALGLLVPALHWLERALAVWGDSGDLLTEARVREALGMVHTSRGALVEAERELLAAASLYRRHGARGRLAAVGPKRAHVRLLGDDAEAAYRLCTDPTCVDDVAANPLRRSERLAVLGVILTRLGRVEEGCEATRTSLALARTSSHPFALVTALRCQAETAIAAGDTTAVRTAAAALLELTRRLRMREQEAWAHVLMAEVDANGAAVRHARAALELSGEHGYQPVEQRAAARLAELGVGEDAGGTRKRLSSAGLPEPSYDGHGRSEDESA